MNKELKTCPFCGNQAEITKKKYSGFIVECTNQSCPASYMIGVSYDTEEEAIKVWNVRRKTEA